MSLKNAITVSLHRAGGESISFGPVVAPGKIALKHGAQGLGMAETSIASSEVPMGHGSYFEGHRMNSHTIFLPLFLMADSYNELHALRYRLERIVSPLAQGELTLRVTTPGRDKWREIPVYYTGGLEGNYGDDYRGVHQTIPLEFKTTEHLWRGQTEYITQQVDPGYKSFLQEEGSTESFFPVILADSTVDGQITFNVAGDAPTYPMWTITPPGSDLSITHTTSGKYVYLDGLFTEPIQIDMNNGGLYITSESKPHGEWMENASIESRGFALTPGNNHLEFSMVGSTVDSKVSITYQPRYLGGI